MSSTETTVACPICSKPYVIYGYYAGDQSACPECRQKARDVKWPGVKDNKPTLDEYDGEE